MVDMVNNPPHYTNLPAHCECGRRLECIDVTRHMHFNIGNAVKYLWRYRDKGGVEDLKKARWYLDDHIKHLERVSENQETKPNFEEKANCRHGYIKETCPCFEYDPHDIT